VPVPHHLADLEFCAAGLGHQDDIWRYSAAMEIMRNCGERYGMIPKSGNRFSEKIMLHK